MATKLQEIPNGTFTITNAETKNHRTFKVYTVQKGNLQGKRILSLLIGPNNTLDYQSVAFIEDDGIKVWRRHQGTEFERLCKFFWLLLTVDDYPHKSSFHILLSKRCRICNRKLTTPESILAGIGPNCAGR